MTDADGNADASSGGIGISAHGNVDISGTRMAGRDYHETTNTTTINKNKRNIRLGLGGVAVAIVVSVAGYGIHAAASASSPSSVVDTPGAQGAAGTVQQLQQAEESGNASTWCYLASGSTSGICQDLMADSFSSSDSASLRNEVSGISVGQPAGSGDPDTYTFDFTYDGHAYPGTELEWNGQRWKLAEEYYLFSLNNGGLFVSVLEAAQGKGAFLGTVG